MNHHILAIGISRHQNLPSNLQFAAKDASEFFNLFVDNIGNLGFRKLLIDSEATLSQTRTALGIELQKAVHPDDAFFFFYSGHGVIAMDMIEESVETHYLVPFDATVDYASTCIPVSFLKQVFEKMATKVKLIFIDSCFSGAATKNSKSIPVVKRKEVKTVKTVSNTISGVGSLTFTASKHDEEAIEDPEFKNGLFTYYLLKELQQERKKESFAVLDIFNPICEQVTRRAIEKYNHKQTPTFQGQLEGSLQLPIFKKRIELSPLIIEIPRYPELVSETFTPPILTIENKDQQKILNEMAELVFKGRESQNTLTSDTLGTIILERFCDELISKLGNEWERIIVENSGEVSKISDSVVKLEAASFQFILLGGVIAVFGSERQMDIYNEYVTQLLTWTQNRAGLVALISTPEIIVLEIIYVIGVLCLVKNNLTLWKSLLQSTVYDYDVLQFDAPPQPLLSYSRRFHYCQALGGYSPKINDHIRDILSNYSWLPALAPKLLGKTTHFQLQVNLLLVLLLQQQNRSLWPDFGRWDPDKIMRLVNKIKYDQQFRRQVAELFELKENEVPIRFAEYLGKISAPIMGGKYMWQSINGEAFLTEEERRRLMESEAAEGTNE